MGPSGKMRTRMENHAPPVVLTLVSDLYFTLRIENAIRARGGVAEFIERVEQVVDLTAAPANDPGTVERSTEEAAAEFVKLLVEKQPAMLIVELDSASLPWEAWIHAAKANETTRRIPIVAFGSHVRGDVHKAARRAGADMVMAKSRFVQALPEIIRKYMQA